MQKLLNITVICFCVALHAQSFQNNGNVQLHENAFIGFHTDVVNNGTFETNANTLVGFYGDFPLLFTGTSPLNTYDTEVLNQFGVFLENSLNIENNLNFINGQMITPRTSPEVLVNFGDNGFFIGESDASKVDGYAAFSNQQNFTFPIGDTNQLRSLVLNSVDTNTFSQCAYFFEDPANPFRLNRSFDPEAKSTTIGEISSQEFWVLTGDVSSNVTLSWNTRSGLGGIALEPEDVIIVGWSRASNQWINLGGVAIGGSINEGFITSTNFVPNDFEVLTLAASPLPLDNFALNNPTLGNYFVSPNGDGINDVFVIDNLDASPNNVLHIFNRLGQKVFEQGNYVNEFRGVANTNGFTPNREIGLPEGIYYYTVSLFDLDLEYRGFLYLDR